MTNGRICKYFPSVLQCKYMSDRLVSCHTEWLGSKYSLDFSLGLCLFCNFQLRERGSEQERERERERCFSAISVQQPHEHRLCGFVLCFVCEIHFHKKSNLYLIYSKIYCTRIEWWLVFCFLNPKSFINLFYICFGCCPFAAFIYMENTLVCMQTPTIQKERIESIGIDKTLPVCLCLFDC